MKEFLLAFCHFARPWVDIFSKRVFFVYSCRLPFPPSTSRICIQTSPATWLWHHGQADQATGQLLWDGDPQTGGVPLRHWHQAWEMPSKSQSVWFTCEKRLVMIVIVEMFPCDIHSFPPICFVLPPAVKLWLTWSSTLKHRSLEIESQSMMEERTSTQLCHCL